METVVGVVTLVVKHPVELAIYNTETRHYYTEPTAVGALKILCSTYLFLTFLKGNRNGMVKQ